MSTLTVPKKIIAVLCIFASLSSVVIFADRNHRDFYQTPIDFLIFLRAGEVYKETGQLYERADNYANKYHPSAAIYKFPPAFQLMLMPLTQLPASVNLHIFTRLLLTSLYVVSLSLLFFYLGNHLKLKREQLFYFGTLLTVIGSWFMPFFESIRWLLTEIPLLFIFIVSFLLLTNNKKLAASSGVLMAYVASAKIYPIFLFSYHLLQDFLQSPSKNSLKVYLQKHGAVLWGFFAGLIVTTAASLYFFGLSEHLFYLKNILPVLLNEPVTDKWVNLNLEKFLFIIGVIPEVTGKIFAITRPLFVGGLLASLFIYRQVLVKNRFLVFSLFVTTMFFCFPNYWPQYQIFLIIPIAFLAANYIKNNNRSLLILLLTTTFTLFVPDLLWKTILAWDTSRSGFDIELIAKESYLNGTGMTLLKYSPLTWLTYYLYEYRALVPVMLWFLQIRQLKKYSTQAG